MLRSAKVTCEGLVGVELAQPGPVGCEGVSGFVYNVASNCGNDSVADVLSTSWFINRRDKSSNGCSSVVSSLFTKSARRIN